MRALTFFRRGGFFLFAWLWAVLCAHAADWPAYGGDASRRHLTDEPLAFPLHAAWRVTSVQPPSPAWPEPILEMNRVDFDYAFQPAIASGLVFIASSADDSARAFNLADGKTRWRFTADAPVRFAPAFAKGMVFFASDDGFAYGLDAANGALVWKRRVALDDRQMLGNGRMISRWPCRAGVLVTDDIVYVVAGMWPSEGIFVHALDARDGRELWCNDTSGGRFMLYPHGGAYAIGGVAPQGYLLASDTLLLVPTGRSVPAAYDRKTGRLVYYRSETHADGGWRVTLAGDAFYAPAHAQKWPMSVPQEKYGPMPGDGLRRFDLATGGTNDALPERHFIVPAGELAYVAGNGAVQALRGGKVVWTAAHPRVFSLARAGNALLVGASNAVSAFNLTNGALLWRGETGGEARGLAVADGRLVVATHLGATVCFAPGSAAADPQPGATLSKLAGAAATLRSGPPSGGLRSTSDLPEHGDALAAFKGIDLSRLTGGYALLIGTSNMPLAEAILKHTGLQVIVLDPNREQVETARAHFLDGTVLYGSRISVQHLESANTLPQPDFFANLVVVAEPVPGLSGRELYRVLRPCGGVLLFPGLTIADTRKLIEQTDASESEIHAPHLPAVLRSALQAGKQTPNTDLSGVVRQPPDEDGTLNTETAIVRGKLPGALDWDSAVANDERLKWPLELIWFGGPGPSRLINRHGTILPIAANGRYFIVGTDSLIAVDAYNGTELWSRPIPGFVSKVGTVAADDDTVYVHFRDSCLALDAQTGRAKATYRKDGKAGNAEEGELRSWDSLPAIARGPLRMPKGADARLRPDPLTGEDVVQTYRRAHGCGSSIASATMHFFRSATYGIYDLEDDSGLRNFSGARPSCALSMLPSLGLLIANEGSGSCICSYNFQSSFALAPAHQRNNEDWAIFYDKPAPAVTRRLALNLGAPGDRRDENDLLWLGMPRPETGLQLECAMDILPGLGSDRINADRTPIEGTTLPWLFAGNITGLTRLTLGLERTGGIVSLATSGGCRIDGVLDDACWDGQFPLPAAPTLREVGATLQAGMSVTDEPSTVFFRHDDACLYLAYRRPAGVDRRGTPPPEMPSISGKDTPVWEGDSFEITLSDEDREKAVHLGLSPAGGRYDALWTYADPFPPCNIPRLSGIHIDAKPDDWGDRGFRAEGLSDAQGFMRATNNLSPSFRLGWDERGVLVFMHVQDNVVIEYPAQTAMWQKDSLELFMAESRDSPNRFQLCIGPGADGLQPKARAFFWDKRTRFPTPLTADVAGSRTPDGYTIEFLLPWSNLGIKPKMGGEVALQLMVNDADSASPKAGDWFRVTWHPDGNKPRALQRLRLVETPSAPWMRERLTPPDKRDLSKAGIRLDLPPIAIPKLEGIVIDGNPDDWKDSPASNTGSSAGRGFQQQSLAAQDGTMRAPENFDPSFRLGWDDEGLLVTARVRDQSIVTDPDPQFLWRKDSIEIFFTPRRGDPDPRHLTIAPPAVPARRLVRHSSWSDGGSLGEGGSVSNPPTHLTSDLPVVCLDGPVTNIATQVRGRRSTDGYLIEARIPWTLLGGKKPAMDAEIALQLFFNDADQEGSVPGDWFRAAWYPQGHAGWDVLAYHRVRLVRGEPVESARGEPVESARDPAPPARFERGERVNDELVRAAAPTPWPLPDAGKGLMGEDRQWDGEWQGVCKADDKAVVCELAIPWRMLDQAGLSRSELITDFSRRGRLIDRPAASFVPVGFRQTAASPVRPYTVRLHFAELRDAAPGTRVFDVLLQGKRVAQDLDVARQAGGPRRALTLEFTGIAASTNLTLELTPKAATPDWTTAPILNGLDIAVEKP